MMRNGRPYTCEEGVEDSGLITDHPMDELVSVIQWIYDNIRTSRTIGPRGSYSLKHVLEHDTGLYLTNNEFKDAMLMAGFSPARAGEVNWRYRAVLVRDVNENQSPFVKWVAKTYGKDDSPEGDFARDAVRDRDFPTVAYDGIIVGYLHRTDGSDRALEVFRGLWQEYLAAKGLGF